ncbi:nucleic-acid-binding protein from transposon X-element [Trichonephila clavipes]|nr:nucleic-acid-binding protein from transposon X-element [Trichonephila clavipes]
MLQKCNSEKLRVKFIKFVITDQFIYYNQQSVRELINLRDSYAIWARKLSIVPAASDEYTTTSAELENIHTALLAIKERMNLPLFRLPISIEALDALIKKVEEQRAHLTPVDSTPKETVPSELSQQENFKKILRLKTDKKRLIDDDGFQTPDKRHTAKKIGKKNPSLPPTTSQTSNTAHAPPPPAESSDSEIEDEETGKSNPTVVGTPQNRIPSIFVNPPDNWCTLISIARQLAPTLISKLTGKFLRITVQIDDEYRKLAQFLRHEGVEYKSFMLKSDRPLKLLIRGLPTFTKVEEIRVEIEREGFQIHKISRLQKFKTKAAMPLIYLQLVNDAKADTIFQFTEMFGTQISFERYDNSRNKRPNQCWRCQGFFHSSEVCHLPIKCLKCAGPHEAKNCNRAFEDPLICANCGGEHAANWRQCPRFPKTKNNKKAPQKGNQNKNQHPKGNNPNNLPQNKIQERNLGSRNDLNLKSSMHAQSKIQQPQSNYRAVIPSVSYSKVVSGQIREITHVNTPNSNFSTIFTNVIQIANDEGVDEELLAQAFRAALRKLSHPNDKACEIFQAYVALKMGVIMLPTIQPNFQLCEQAINLNWVLERKRSALQNS